MCWIRTRAERTWDSSDVVQAFIARLARWKRRESGQPNIRHRIRMKPVARLFASFAFAAITVVLAALMLVLAGLVWSRK
ncbi:MAG: hypothetical protein IPG16_13265 [Comamonadaceae bacterium]|jgi:hypothetical protein|nr:hypothetical protein [Comamonadaceae bacterium]